MASDLSSSFFAHDDDDEYTQLYCPDFSLVRKRPTNHTTIRARIHKETQKEEHDTYVEVTRPDDEDGMIPITEADAVLTDHHIFNGSKGFILSRNKRFDDFIALLNQHAKNITVSYDNQRDIRPSQRVVTTYTVPLSGFIKVKDIPSGNPISFPSDAEDNEGKEINIYNFRYMRESFIIIDGKRYSNFRTYKRLGMYYVPINLPRDKNFLQLTEQIFPFTKKSISKDSLTFTFHSDVSINSVILHPENCRFEYVHSTKVQCNQHCVKMKHCICVLENDPQFISKFELHYRSELTDGRWVKHGVFAGSVSIFNKVRVDFDEIQVKEFRVVPLTFHKGFDKITIDAVGAAIHTASVSTDLVVTYKVFTPCEGKYVHRFDKLKLNKYHFGCKCSTCTGISRKGENKQKHLNFIVSCSEAWQVPR